MFHPASREEVEGSKRGFIRSVQCPAEPPPPDTAPTVHGKVDFLPSWVCRGEHPARRGGTTTKTHETKTYHRTRIQTRTIGATAWPPEAGQGQGQGQASGVRTGAVLHRDAARSTLGQMAEVDWTVETRTQLITPLVKSLKTRAACSSPPSRRPLASARVSSGDAV